MSPGRGGRDRLVPQRCYTRLSSRLRPERPPEQRCIPTLRIRFRGETQSPKYRGSTQDSQSPRSRPCWLPWSRRGRRNCPRSQAEPVVGPLGKQKTLQKGILHSTFAWLKPSFHPGTTRSKILHSSRTTVNEKDLATHTSGLPLPRQALRRGHARRAAPAHCGGATMPKHPGGLTHHAASSFSERGPLEAGGDRQAKHWPQGPTQSYPAAG